MQIYKPNLAELLPPSLQYDEKLVAVANALSLELEKLSAQCELVLHLPRLNDLPHEVLDHLAYQYHVDFYSSDYSLQMKRKMLRETFYLHRIKGTPASVEKFLSAIMKNPVVEEFFEYSGEPYFFKITTGGLYLEIDNEEEFLRLINHAKNLRSWLDSIIFDLTIEESHLISVAQVYNFGGEVFTDIKQPSGENFYFFHTVNENISGIEKTNLSQNFNCDAKIFFTANEKISGIEITDAELNYNEKWFWKYLLLEKWKNLNDNPVINIYFHREHGDKIFDIDGVIKCYYSAREKISGVEITDVSMQSFDNPDAKISTTILEQVAGFELTDTEFIYWDGDDDPLPVDQDFLRLYFDCGTGFKNLTVYNPKPNLTKNEINPLGNFIIDKKILQNKKGDSVKKLIRALLFYKSNEKIL